MSRREKKMRTKRKSIKKDEDKEEKEKTFGRAVRPYLFHTFIIYGQCDGCVKKSGKIGMIFFTFGG